MFMTGVLCTVCGAQVYLFKFKASVASQQRDIENCAWYVR